MIMRRGVSLMEVLFAVGVVAVGLFGVVALYPVALGLIGQGHVADMSFRLGQDAVRDFETRGMGQALKWRYANGNTITTGANPHPVITPFISLNPSLPTSHPLYDSTGTLFRTSFAVDPRFVARHGNTAVGEINTNYFPYYSNTGSFYPSTPRMTRITLATLGGLQVLRGAEADGIFILNDELIFDLPDDKLLPPIQQFGPAPARRQSEGTLSWMATVCPIIDTSSSIKDRYLLSIVVFNRRDPTFSLFEDFSGNSQYDVGEGTNERIVAVSQFYGSGLSGGDVELASAAPAELELKSNDWLMLMTRISDGTNPAIDVFRWYRVLETEEQPRSDPSTLPTFPEWKRDVTLDGGDFPTPIPGVIANSTACLVSNVAYVYETTIRLETSGLWTD